MAEVEKNKVSLAVGAYGWEHEGWVVDFYPQDLPEDWRLAYYANEFFAVLVPAVYWLEERAPDAGKWREDVHERFRFYLELDATLVDSEHWEQMGDVASALGEHLGGCLLNLEPDRLPGVVEALRTRLPACPLYAMEPTSTLRRGHCWRSELTPCPCACVGVVRYDQVASPPEMREVLEGFVACAQSDHPVLFIKGNTQALRDASTMAQLLGVD